MRRRIWQGTKSLLLFLLLLPLFRGFTSAQVKPVRRVLIFYELGLSSPSDAVLDGEIRTALENSPFQIELYREYLETTLFSEPETQKEIRSWYIHKYRNRRLDVVITIGPSPLKFLMDTHKTGFKDVPVVFGGISGAQHEILKLDSEFTGVWDRVEPAKTLETALRLQPSTRRVVVVGGRDAFDLELEAWFHESLHSYESKLDFSYLTDLSMPQLLERLSHLPANTIILLTHIGLDGAGTRFVGASQADPLVVKAANAPVFGPSDVDLGHGEVGGYLDSFRMQGKIMGEMAVKILKGQRPQSIPMVEGANVYMFDWRALKRWGFSERKLPSGSVVINRSPTFWEAYKEYVITAIFVLLAQSFAIVALLWQMAQRRKTQMALSKSEEKFSKAFQRSPLGLTLASLVDYRLIELNDTFERYTGWRRDEIIGLTSLQIKFWVDLNQRSSFIEQLRTKGAVRNQEILFRKKDGEVRTGLVSSELIDLNGEACALSLMADISEAKHAEDARRESEERFRLVANRAPVLIWMAGPDRLCTYFNDPWLDFTGRPLEKELGNGWVEDVHPEDSPLCFHIYMRAFERREEYRMEYRLRRRDGEYRWVEDRGVPRFGPDGSFAGYIGSCVDITDRKTAAAALSSVSGRLIEAQEQERTRIARELHDDINQRLALLAMDLEQLKITPLRSAELRERAAQLFNRTSEISSDIQALSHRLHSSKLEYLGLVPAMKGFCAEFAEQQKVQINFTHGEVPSTLNSEISLCLFRILQEGLINAIKHSGVQHFEARLCCARSAIQLTIRDKGVGFDPGTAMNSQGLGLISMRERVSLVKGTISITSKPMGGTEITARIPVDLGIEDSQGEVSVVTGSIGRPRVLLADDQPEILETVEQLLEGQCEIVAKVDNGESMLDAVARLDPDLVVLDISMPVLNGIEAAWRLKESGSRAKVIFLTVAEDPGFVEAAFSAGALGYVSKPHLVSDVVPAVREVLQGHVFASQFLEAGDSRVT